jgi:Spy/CpxP family protein refolding chaperone
MMKTFPGALLVALLLTVAQAALAQGKPFDGTDLEALRTAVKADKKALVVSTMNLGDVEGRKFWPLYDAYQQKLDGLNRRKVRAVVEIVSRDKPLSDPLAKALIAEFIAIGDDEVKALRAYQNRLNKALPPRKVARYLQLESKVRAIEDYDIAATLPLVN